MPIELHSTGLPQTLKSLKKIISVMHKKLKCNLKRFALFSVVEDLSNCIDFNFLLKLLILILSTIVSIFSYTLFNIFIIILFLFCLRISTFTLSVSVFLLTVFGIDLCPCGSSHVLFFFFLILCQTLYITNCRD